MVCAAAFNSVFVPIFLYVPDNTGQRKLPADTSESYLSAVLQILVNQESKDNSCYQSESKISSIHLRLVKGQKRDSQDLFPSRSVPTGGMRPKSLPRGPNPGSLYIS